MMGQLVLIGVLHWQYLISGCLLMILIWISRIIMNWISVIVDIYLIKDSNELALGVILPLKEIGDIVAAKNAKITKKVKI